MLYAENPAFFGLCFPDNFYDNAFGTVTIKTRDDDPIVRSLMRDALEDEGFSVVEAEDGVEACRVCEERLPVLLVVDVVMPQMDGVQTLRAIRELDAAAREEFSARAALKALTDAYTWSVLPWPRASGV